MKNLILILDLICFNKKLIIKIHKIILLLLILINNNMDQKRENRNHIRLDVIDKIIKLYPEMKKEKKNIIYNIFGTRKEETGDEYIVEKFKYKDLFYYRDKNGLIRTAETDIVGVYEILDGEYKYYFFDEFRKLDVFKKKLIFSEKI